MAAADQKKIQAGCPRKKSGTATIGRSREGGFDEGRRKKGSEADLSLLRDSSGKKGVQTPRNQIPRGTDGSGSGEKSAERELPSAEEDYRRVHRCREARAANSGKKRKNF